MVMHNAPAMPERRSHKNVQLFTRSVQELPATSVLDSVLETMEKDLTRRGLLQIDGSGSYHPLWFLAETERNIFLWRHGMSIEEHEHFEFWIDVPRLIEKRLAQLEGFSPENPFLNPLWGELPYDQEQSSIEANYLKSFTDIALDILPHAHALSHIGSTLRKESIDGRNDGAILLPLVASSPKG